MHFDDHTWIDFVRGTADASTQNTIVEHLDRGCEECRQAKADWQMVLELARHDVSLGPTDDIVRMVKQEFSVQYPREDASNLIASLIFDSLSQPAVAGVRSAATTARQLVFKANDITIDLRFEFDLGAQKKSFLVVGQILRGEEKWDAPVPVLLFNDNGALVAETETTEFGEFQLEFDSLEHTRISFELSGSRRVQVPLDDVEALPK